jgi:hypothetical protein
MRKIRVISHVTSPKSKQGMKEHFLLGFWRENWKKPIRSAKQWEELLWNFCFWLVSSWSMGCLSSFWLFFLWPMGSLSSQRSPVAPPGWPSTHPKVNKAWKGTFWRENWKNPIRIAEHTQSQVLVKGLKAYSAYKLLTPYFRLIVTYCCTGYIYSYFSLT